MFDLFVQFGLLGTLALFVVLWDIFRPKGQKSHHIRRQPEALPTQENDPNSPSPNFAALIHAINTQGDAARSEEQTEDRGKRFREYIIIALLGLTLCISKCQFDEMKKVYLPISDQADALKADQRPWIGAPEITREIKGDQVEFKAKFKNSGKGVVTGLYIGITIENTGQAGGSGNAQCADGQDQAEDLRVWNYFRATSVIPGDAFLVDGDATAWGIVNGKVVHDKAAIKVKWSMNEIEKFPNPQIVGCAVYGSIFFKRPKQTAFWAHLEVGSQSITIGQIRTPNSD